MLKNFLLKQLIKSKMKDVPEAEIDKMVSLVEKNPDFFKNIASEVEQKMKEGKDQMAAVMEVMKKHESTLKELAK